MTAIPVTTGRNLEQSLATLGGQIASLIPAMMLGYMTVIWPLAFGEAGYSAIEMQMGWMAPLPADAGTPSPYKAIAYPALFMLSLVCALFTAAYRRFPLTNPAIIATVAIIALAIGSAAWSTIAVLSFVRGVQLTLITLAVIMAVFSAHSFNVMMRGLFYVLVAATVLNLISVVTTDPGYIGHNGIYAQKNVFGWVSAIILFFGIYHLTYGGTLQRTVALIMIASAPIFLFMSQSKTSFGLALLAPMIGLALVYAARRMRISPALVVTVTIALAILIFFIGRDAGLWTFKSINEALLGDPTLTGRTDIWDFAVTLIEKRPLLGYGYEGVWGTGYDGIPYKTTLGYPRVTPTGHNGYIDMLVHLGVVGFALKAVFIVSMLIVAGRLASSDWRLGWLSLTIASFVLLHNGLESDIFISSNPLSMLLMLFLAIGLRLTAQTSR
jgi:exopolysaccharide production protein ExoQ